MNILYLLSGAFNRIVVFLAMLIFSRILDPENFGIYSLIVSNSLFIQILIGSWLSAGAGREFAISPPDDWPSLIKTIAYSVGLIALLLITAGTILAETDVTPADWETAYATVFLTISLILFETFQSIQNALGRSKTYAAIAIVRGATILAVGALAAYYTRSVIAIVIAQMLANIAPMSALLLYNRRKLRISSIVSDRVNISRLMKLGFDGTMLFGYYIIIMMLTRNIVASYDGLALSGMLGLSVDFFFAPLALLSSSMSLSYMPKLYQQARDGSEVITARSLASFYVFSHAIISILYMMFAVILLVRIAPILLPPAANAIIAENAYSVGLFSIGVVMAFSIMTVFLTSGLKLHLRVLFSIGIASHIVSLYLNSVSDTSVSEMAWSIALAQLATTAIGICLLMFAAMQKRERNLGLQ